MSDADHDLEIVREAIDRLMEHFDSVQIFATRYESDNDGNTVSVKMGSGNWFSRYGVIHEWLERCNETARCEVRGENEGEG